MTSFLNLLQLTFRTVKLVLVLMVLLLLVKPAAHAQNPEAGYLVKIHEATGLHLDTVSGAQNGMLIYNTTNHQLYYYANGGWKSVEDSLIDDKVDSFQVIQDDSLFLYTTSNTFKIGLNDNDSLNEKLDTVYVQDDSLVFVEGVDTLYVDYNDGDWEINENGANKGVQAILGGSTASGNYSMAGGLSNTASGFSSLAIGGGFNSVSGLNASNVGGSTNEVNGNFSSNLGGFDNEVSGFYATSIGGETNQASGDNSTVIGGENLDAISFGETVLGFNNTLYAASDSFGIDSTDKLLVVGNGVSPISRSNALTLLKDGRLGLGVDGNANQSATLHIKPQTSINPLRVEDLRDSINVSNKLLVAAADGTIFQASLDSLTIAKDSSEWTDQGSYILARRAAESGDTVVVGDNGYLGIGTSTPQRALHFSAPAAGTLTAMAIENANTTDDNGNVVSFRTTTSGAGGTDFVEMAGFQVKHTDHNHSTRSSNFSLFASDEEENAGQLSFLTLQGNGDVMIGNDSATSKLDVDGDLRIRTIDTSSTLDTILVVDSAGAVHKTSLYDKIHNMVEIYDSTGTQVVNYSSQRIKMAAVGIQDGLYSVTDSNITVKASGRYKITYRVTIEMGTSNNRSTAEHVLLKNGIVIPGTFSGTYHRNSLSNTTTGTVVKIVELDENDVISLQSEQTTGSGDLSTVKNGSSLMIEFVKP